MNNGYSRTYVLDAFAMMAYLEGEPGAQPLIPLFEAAQAGQLQLFFSIINVGEVYYILAREQDITMAKQGLGLIEQLPLQIVDATRERVLAAAHLKANYAISYADAFAVAAAQEFDATILTGDPEFKRVAHLVTVEWLASS